MTGFPYANHTVRELLKVFIDTFGEEFKKKPGSLTNHHMYPGGLVQHTHEVWKTSQELLKIFDNGAYPPVNKDIMLFGALLHDISKIEEYTALEDGTFKRNPVSNLSGNTANSALMFGAMVNKLTSQGVELDPEVVGLLQHILLSHHLKREWGSPVVPLCLEAYFVAIADQISSKVANFAGGLEEDTEPNEPLTSRYYFWNNERLYKVPKIDPDFGKEPKTLFDE
jgi:3'-5' exoribonuclease